MFSPISILVTTVIVALLISLLVMLRISMKVADNNTQLVNRVTSLEQSVAPSLTDRHITREKTEAADSVKAVVDMDDNELYRWFDSQMEEQSKDLHNIVTDLKKALLKGKWLSTGVSKNGMTTYDYAYYFPGEMDVYVPFVAPMPYYSRDSRIGDYVVNKSVTDYLPQIKAAFQKCANDKTIYDAVAAAYKKKEETPEAKIKDDSLAFETMSGIITYLFKK